VPLVCCAHVGKQTYESQSKTCMGRMGGGEREGRGGPEDTLHPPEGGDKEKVSAADTDISDSRRFTTIGRGRKTRRCHTPKTVKGLRPKVKYTLVGEDKCRQLAFKGVRQEGINVDVQRRNNNEWFAQMLSWDWQGEINREVQRRNNNEWFAQMLSWDCLEEKMSPAVNQLASLDLNQ
jgi:hypothetical protein